MMGQALELFGFKGRVYKPGDSFETEGVDGVDLINLSTENNGLGKPLIELPDINKMNVSELKELAKSKEIEGYSNMKKDDLITALTEEGK